MKNLVVFFAMVLGLSSISLAESQAKKDRHGWSCTDMCTINGKGVTKFAHSSLSKEKNHTMYCSQDRASIPGNIHWCKQNCMEKGGFLSKKKDRQRQVKEFLEWREKDCASLQE